MKKYIAVQVAPEAADFDFLYDDYISDCEGLEYAVIGLSPDYYRDTAFLNAELYKEINQAIEEIEEAFEDIRTGDGWYSSFYSSYKEAVNDILYKYCTYSPRLVADLKKLFNQDDYTIAEFLTVVTRKSWTEQGFRGYSQGDYCTLIYCEDVHKEDFINLLGGAAVGCVSEFSISENRIETEGRNVNDIVEEAREACCYGYYIRDDDLWDDKGREIIAEQIGAKPEEVEVLTIEESRGITQYDYKIA